MVGMRNTLCFVICKVIVETGARLLTLGGTTAYSPTVLETQAVEMTRCDMRSENSPLTWVLWQCVTIIAAKCLKERLNRERSSVLGRGDKELGSGDTDCKKRY